MTKTKGGAPASEREQQRSTSELRSLIPQVRRFLADELGLTLQSFTRAESLVIPDGPFFYFYKVKKTTPLVCVIAAFFLLQAFVL